MLLSFQNYINNDILNNLQINFSKENDIYRLISKNIYYLDYYLDNFNINNRYNLGLKAIQDFYFQIRNFQDRGFTFLAFNLNEILIIDGNKFLLIPHELCKLNILNSNINTNELKKLLVDHNYIPPELRKIPRNNLPLSTNNYSIGLLVLKIIFNNSSTKNLEYLKYSWLYYCLTRCLQINPKHRMFVLV